MKKKSGNFFDNILGRVEKNGFVNNYWQLLFREGKYSGNSQKLNLATPQFFHSPLPGSGKALPLALALA